MNIICARCRKPVDRLEGSQHNPILTLRAHCHGEIDTRDHDLSQWSQIEYNMIQRGMIQGVAFDKEPT